MPVDWLHLPPLSSLRAFTATADARSFSQAARALNVTHAAVVQQVRALERHLSVLLVVREGRGIALTAEGRQLATALAEGFGQIDTGIRALQAGGSDRPVRVTLTASFAAQWLMPRLRDFWQKHPDIALTLHPDRRIVDLLRDGMDLGIRYGRGSWPGVEAVYLASARLGVVGAPSLLGTRTDLSTVEMAEMDWVIARDWPEQNDYLRSLGLQPEMLSQTDFPSDELSIAAARQGLGLAVESIALIEGDISEGRLRLVHDSKDSAFAYYLVTLPGPQRPAVRAFLKWVTSVA
jgi:LysR family transcriptional regulator, glycine cleavage system transcriptional activator